MPRVMVISVKWKACQSFTALAQDRRATVRDGPIVTVFVIPLHAIS